MPISYKDRPSTNENYVYRSLGSFWTQIFRDKDALQGYTRAQVEEIIQRYYELIEVVQNFSVKDTQILHKEKWKPIQLFKSKLDKVPFIFEPSSAVFGAQPENDSYYRELIFKFGFDKVSNQDVFQYFVGADLHKFGLIADRVIAPTKLYIYGADVVLINGTLRFNQNIFEDSSLEKFDVIGDDGVPVTFIDFNGVVQNEQSCIIWLYNAEIDLQDLYNNFGYIFNLRIADLNSYKQVLGVLFSLFVKGPTVRNIQTLCATALNLPVVLNNREVISELFSDSKNQFIVTDLECYKLPLTSVLRTMNIGDTLYAGDLLTTDIEYYDNGSCANGWWKKTGVITKKLGFSKYLFLGNYINQLSFSSELDIIAVDALGNVVFPVLGTVSDVLQFNSFLNADPDRQALLKAYFNLSGPGATAPFIPLDFIMDNFLKLNVAFLKFRFESDLEMSDFLRFIPFIKENIPPHIYLIIKIDIVLPVDDFTNLNGDVFALTVGDSTVMLNADATDANGYIAPFDPDEHINYTHIHTRLFEIGRAIHNQPHELVGVYGVIDAQADTDGRRMTVKDGALLHTPPDHSSTADFNKLLFLDFL